MKLHCVQGYYTDGYYVQEETGDVALTNHRFDAFCEKTFNVDCCEVHHKKYVQFLLDMGWDWIKEE